MKKIIFVVAVSAFLFSSCSSSPEVAAKDFAENLIIKGKIEEAKKHATESTGKMLDMANALGGGIEIHPNAKIKASTDSIKGNKAWVKMTVINEDGEENVDTFNMVKVDGDWKVHVDTKK